VYFILACILFSSRCSPQGLPQLFLLPDPSSSRRKAPSQQVCGSSERRRKLRTRPSRIAAAGLKPGVRGARPALEEQQGSAESEELSEDALFLRQWIDQALAGGRAIKIEGCQPEVGKGDT
jgi:hypothetical protein